MNDLPPPTTGDPLAQLFPGPSGLGRPPRRRARRALVGGAAAAVLVLGGVAVASARESDGGGVRTAVVAEHTVDQVLRSVATVEPVSQASVAFPVAGTVSQVDVKVGDTVVVGKPLATLDTVALERTLHQKEATLAEAELKLEKALNGEDVGGTGSAPSGGTGPTTGISLDTSSSSTAPSARTISYATASTTVPETGTPATGAPVSGGPSEGPSVTSGSNDAELQAAQQAVLDAQKAVDASLAASEQALESATQVCAMTGTDVPATPAAGEPSPTTTPAAGASGATDPSVAACQAALQQVLVAQQQVAADQATLATASSTLNQLIEAGATTPDTGNGGTGTTPDSGSIPSAGPSSGGAPTSGGPTTGNPTTGGADSTSTSPSAEALVAYQKAVDAAEAQVTVAQQAVAQATIVSPISGTVASSVGFAVGDDVTAASSTQTVVVVGDGGYEVTTSISVDDIPDVKVGQSVTVTPDGSSKTIRGEVVRIGVAATSGSSSTTYTVTIGLTGDTSGLGNGATASVAIVTDAATKAVSVPTSAVTVNGDRHTVKVVDGDTTKTVDVKVGAIGDVWTEITSGVKVGQEVVIADLSEPLPGSATSSSSNGQNGRGGDRPTFTAGPGGFPGGPPTGARPGN